MHIEYVEWSQDAPDGTCGLSAGSVVERGENPENVLAVTQDWVNRQLGLPEEAAKLRAELDDLLAKRALQYDERDRLGNSLTNLRRDIDLTREKLTSVKIDVEIALVNLAQKQAEIAKVAATFHKMELAGKALDHLVRDEVPTGEEMDALADVIVEKIQAMAEKYLAQAEKVNRPQSAPPPFFDLANVKPFAGAVNGPFTPPKPPTNDMFPWKFSFTGPKG